MSITLLTAAGVPVVANERSTVYITGAYRDEAGSAVTPDSATWSLTDTDGAAINSRTAVALTPATTYAITLTGADLQAAPNGKAGRCLLVAWRYDSSAGTDLYGTEEIRFTVADLAGVT